MDRPRFDARSAFDALLQSRCLTRPTGKPLYEYRFSRQDFEYIATVLRATRGRFLDDRHGCALFVAFTAEWFRRDREGGHWDWIHPLAALGVRYHASDPRAQVRYPEVRRAAEAGLAVWRRHVPSGVKILYRVIAESGFPAASIRQGPRLASWLKRSVLDIEIGFSPEDAVRQESWRAGDSLVQALFEPAVALCRVIAELRASLPEGIRADAVLQLDSIRSNWRAELPFDLEEQDVRRLVEDLVRAQREQTSGLGVVRRLRRSGEHWAQLAELELSGTLDHKKLPEGLRATLNGVSRVRVRPGGALAEFGRAVVALERVQDEELDQWEVRPLVQGFDAPLPMGEELRLQVVANGQTLADFVAFGGEALKGPVVALQPVDGTSADDVTELEVLGTSPVRSTRPWLALAVEESCLPKLIFQRKPIDLGEVGVPRRRIIAFQGCAEFDLDGERVVWRSQDEKQRAMRLVLVGDILGSIREQVFRGCPQAWLMDGEYGQLVSRRELIWRCIGSKEWFSIAEVAPLGRVELAVRRNGELLALTRAEIVPADFLMIPDTRTLTLRLSGLNGAVVAASGLKPLRPERDGDAVAINLAEHTRGANVHLSLRWSTTVGMTLPDPVTNPVLLAPNGKSVVRARLSVGRLPGYRLLAPERRSLLFELRGSGTHPVYATREVEGLMPMAACGDLIRQLLGGCENLDACVRLAWLGHGDWVAEVGWYDLDQPLTLTSGNSSSPFEILSRASAPILKAFSLVNPKSSVFDLPFTSELEATELLQEHLGAGPWLLSGSTPDGYRLRPKVVGSSATPVVGPLLAAFAKTSRGERDAALDSCFTHPGELTPAELRHLVDLCVAAAKADAPYASIDGLRALCRNPRAAVYVLAECGTFGEREAVLRLQTELPILWCTTPIVDWIDAFSTRRARLAHKMQDIGETIATADAAIAKAIVQIVDLQPALSMHARTAMLLMGEVVTHDPSAVERICRSPTPGLGTLIQELVKCHGDGDDPPSGLGLAMAVPTCADLWDRYNGIYADIIAAPLVAAGLATGELNQRAYLTACRAAWIYDRDYFENAVLCALFQRVTDTPR